MKILLTGASGFIGSHVARALAGHEVQTLVRPQCDLLAADFRLPSSRFDACIHLAWYVESGKYLDSPLNIDWVAASLRLARQLHAAGCRRFVVAGTCFEYTMSTAALRESSPTEPDTLYGQSKLDLLHALQALDLDLVWARIFYQYGPREDSRRLVPNIIRALLRNEPAALTPGEQIRDFLHIADVADAIASVASGSLTGIINIGSGAGVTVREIALTIGDIMGRRELIQLGDKPYACTEAMHVVADNTKLRATGWKPRYDLVTGLRHTIDWWRTRV